MPLFLHAFAHPDPNVGVCAQLSDGTDLGPMSDALLSTYAHSDQLSLINNTSLPNNWWKKYTNNRELDAHQISSLIFLLKKDHVILGDEAGLGKTITAIVAMNALPLSNVLIVTPASIKFNWLAELKTWLQHDLNVKVITGTKDTFVSGINIINYDLLHSYKEVLRGSVYDLIILDEAHRIKNSESKRAQVLLGNRKFPKLTTRKWLFMTGTPLNRPKDLYNMLRVTDPTDTARSEDYYHYRYCDAKILNGYVDVNGASNTAELKDKLKNVMIRHTADVLNLPPLVLDTLTIEGSQEYLTAEQKLFADVLSQLGVEPTAEEMSDLILKEPVEGIDASVLKIVYSVLFEKASELRKLAATAKTDIASDFLLDRLNESPTLYFGVHKQHLKDVQTKISKSYRTALITGDVSSKKRLEIVNAFQNGEIDCVLANLHAAGEGLTLTRAEQVVIGETDWNYTTVWQALKRAHRRGQTKTVRGHFLVLNNSIDANVTMKMIRKLRTSKEILGED